MECRAYVEMLGELESVFQLRFGFTEAMPLSHFVLAVVGDELMTRMIQDD